MGCLTQAKIAKELDISQSTVSIVLANPMTKRVSDETRQRIFDYINKIDPSFKPKKRNIGDICYLTPATSCVSATLYTRLLDGAEAEAKEQGLNLIFKRWETMDDFTDLFADSNISGIIHCGETTQEAIKCLQCFAPTVLLNYTFENMICNMVTIDNHGAIRQAMRHCFTMGHRQIGFVNYQQHYSQGHFLDRLGGYYEGLYSLDLPIKPEYVMAVDFQSDPEPFGPEKVIDQLLNMPDRPTAMICVNDEIAISIMKAAVQAGLTLPDDLSVTGFDYTEMGRQWRPALTTIHQKREDMGRAAVALLTRKIKEGRNDIPEKVLCEAELIVRESVAKQIVV
ncbi:MAG: LacI family transcriptional regulator [Phycisphaerae bacterium]|jgi:DNA-binding LacI/PurR family transcriptional regulator|nr:LacI family transcriptional regulator [Phycisphaerae bacterium]